MFAKINLFSSKGKRFSPWWFGLKLGVIVAIVIWWWLQEQDEGPKSVEIKRVVLPKDGMETAPLKKVQSQLRPKAKPKAVEPDDLTAIDGIGPKYATVLNDAGVTTFAQLATMEAEEIRDVFRTAVGRAPDPSGWIEQAKAESK